MRRRTTRPLKTTFVLALLLASAPWLAGTAAAADQADVVRGLIQKQLASGKRVPAPQLEVKLVDGGREVAKTFTRSDGMYHLRDVPYGRYEVQVEHRGETKRRSVVVDDRVEDVPPIVLR